MPGEPVMPGAGSQIFPPMLAEEEDERWREARRRAEQPAGAVFALGWVMAQLYDPQRRVSVTVRQPPFDPDAQLPQVADLAADPKLVFLAAELAEYLHWFPRLRRSMQPVAAAARPAAPAGYSDTALLDAVTGLNQAILDEFADDPERLSAYQLGLALSDLVWLPSGRGAGSSPPSTLFGLFARTQLATVQTLLNGAGKQLPAGTATIVSRSLDNWADWIDVNSARLKAPAADAWTAAGDVVLSALRVQGWVWHSVLIGDPEVSVQPGMGAWVEAGSSIARAARLTAEVFLRRFWPVAVIALLALGGLLYLVISNLSGVSQVWASLVTVAAVIGSGGWGLSSAVSSAFDGIGYEIWSAAKVDAAAWNVTWLPALTTTTVERAKMERRGVAMPQIRKSLDI
jgi:hypothetical protein